MMSCFGPIRTPKTRRMPGHEDTDEYVEYRRRVQAEHRIAFLPSLQALIAFVTNKDRHCDVDEIRNGDLKLLDRVRYFRVLKSRYTDVEFTVDTRKGKVRLRGQGTSFEKAFDACFKEVREMDIVERNLCLNLEEKWKWDIVANMHCQQYFEEHMNDIMAKVCVIFI